MKFSHILAISASVAALGTVAHATAYGPPAGADPSANIIITYGPGGSISTVDNGFGPYDGVEDTYIAVVNNSSNTIFGTGLSSALCIGCFDGDGIDGYTGASNATDTTGYGGPATFFTNNLGTSLTANYIGGIAPGSYTYFSLEESVSLSQLAVPEPAAWATMVLGLGLLGAGLRSRQRAARSVA